MFKIDLDGFTPKSILKMGDFGRMDIKECAPTCQVPPYRMDGEKVIWIKTEPKKFDKKDVDGLSFWNYGAVYVVQVEGDKKIMEEWTIFFHNHLDCNPQKMYSMPGFRVFYVNKERFRRAIESMSYGLRVLRRESGDLEENAKNYSDLFLENIPAKYIDCRPKTGEDA